MRRFKHHRTAAALWTDHKGGWPLQAGVTDAARDKSAETVLWEMQVILAAALGSALAVNSVLALLHIA